MKPTFSPLLRLEDLIPSMEQALIDFSAGRVHPTGSQIVSIAPHNGRMGLMPAVYGDVMGAKLVNVYPDNGARLAYAPGYDRVVSS